MSTDIYLHAVNTTGDVKDIDGSVTTLEKILATGAILTRKALGLAGCGFNGTNCISLSDYSLRYDHARKDDSRFYDYTAYELYTSKALSLMIDESAVKVIHPTLIPPMEKSVFSLLRFYYASFDMTFRHLTDLPDEVQVRGCISEDAFRGVSMPTIELAQKMGVNKAKEVFLKVKELLKKYEYNMGIYDVSSLEELESEKDVEGIIKRSL